MSFADISDLALVMLIIVGSILFVLFIGCILLEFLWEIEHPPRVEYSDNMTEKSAGVFMYQNYNPRRGPGQYYEFKFLYKNGRWKYKPDIDKKTYVYILIALAVIFPVEIFVIGIAYLPATVLLNLFFASILFGVLGMRRLCEWIHACFVLDHDIRKRGQIL